MQHSGKNILDGFLKKGELNLNKEEVIELEYLIDINLQLCSSRGVSYNLTTYIRKVKERDERVYYSDEVIDNNIDHFAECWRSGLSPYKAILFFGDYLEDKDKDIDEKD